MKFRDLKEAPGDPPIFGITESGQDMMLVIAFIGQVEYDRKDSQALAEYLERAAEFVREHE